MCVCVRAFVWVQGIVGGKVAGDFFPSVIYAFLPK